MENNVTRRSFLPIILLFIIFSLLIWVLRPLPVEWKTDYRVLLAGNGLLFLVTLVSFYLYTKGLRNSNAHYFVRMMYGSLLVKMFVCLLAVLIYVMLAGRGVNRNGVIGCFILYLLYTFLEVRLLRKNV